MQQVEKWDVFEISQGAHVPGNPFDVDFGAEFNQAGNAIKVAGFYDGASIFKVRFMPAIEGKWTYTTYSNIESLDNQQGAFDCIPPAADNHGPVRVANKYHFAYADGTPYVPVGTTCYVWNLQGDALEEQTLKTLDTAPFNKMRMSVFPKRYSFNSNEPPSYPFPMKVDTIPDQPWSREMVMNSFADEPPQYWDYSQFNPNYFQHLEKRILDLQARGIEADLIVFHPYDYNAWGFDRMPAEVNDRYLKYLVARLSAYRNLWWSFANEYDLFFGRTLEDWDQTMQLVQDIDPHDHLRSIHNCFAFYDHTKPWVTHCSVQSHFLNRMPEWHHKYGKPVVVDECGYEGDIHMMWGDLSPQELVLRFWTGFTLGGYVGHGETYVNPEDVLWWSKGGQLHGESTPRIAFLRQIFEQTSVAGLTGIEKQDNETIHLLDRQNPLSIFRPQGGEMDQLIAEGRWNAEAVGYCGGDYYLFYYGMHQPRSRTFNLPAGSFYIDIIDTWNMTIETYAKNASGNINVELPARKYMAVRIQRNK